MTKNLCVFWFTLAKRECKVSQGRGETLFKWGGKRLRQIYSGQYVPNFITIGQVL